VPAALAIALLCIGILPVAADLSTRSPTPFAELPDGSTPTLPLTVGSGPSVATWVAGTAATSLPPVGSSGPASASARVWILPPIPAVSVASNVRDFDPSITAATAARMAHDVVLDLIILSEARRAHDFKLAQSAATSDGLTEFTDVMKQDIAAGKIIQKTYSFDRISLQLFLPKFSTQGARLVGISLHGTSTLTTRDASGNQVSQASSTYAKIWGLVPGATPASNQLIFVDYTGLALAP
jgi:hypothetical protein